MDKSWAPNVDLTARVLTQRELYGRPCGHPGHRVSNGRPQRNAPEEIRTLLAIRLNLVIVLSREIEFLPTRHKLPLACLKTGIFPGLAEITGKSVVIEKAKLLWSSQGLERT